MNDEFLFEFPQSSRVEKDDENDDDQRDYRENRADDSRVDHRRRNSVVVVVVVVVVIVVGDGVQSLANFHLRSGFLSRGQGVEGGGGWVVKMEEM